MFNFLSKALNFGTKIDLSLQIIGSLQLKEIGAQIIELSPECKLQIQQDNQNEFSLLLTNTENVDNWENLSFQISFDRHFKKYVSGINTCLLWEKNQTFYIFEILVDVENKNNTEPFFDNLSQILEMLEGGQKRKYYIDNYDEIEDIDAFLEQNYQHYRINETSKAVDDLSSGIGNIKVSYPPIPQRIKEAKLIFRAPGEFYDYNQGDDEIKLLAEKCFFCIYLMNITEYEFGLSVEKDDTLISYDVFTPSTSYQVTKDCFLWLSHSDNFNTKAVSFIFEDKLLLISDIALFILSDGDNISFSYSTTGFAVSTFLNSLNESYCNKKLLSICSGFISNTFLPSLEIVYCPLLTLSKRVALYK